MLDGRHDPAFARLFQGEDPAAGPRLSRALGGVLAVVAAVLAASAIAALAG